MSNAAHTAALILAAGRGSRLGAHTEARPKGMVELLGRPMLQWQVDALHAAGIDEVTVATGYRAEVIEALGVPTVHNAEWEHTNMVGTLLAAAAHFTAGPVIVSYSDIVYHPDHVRALSAAHASLAITYDRRWEDLWSLRFADPLSDAETFDIRDGQLVTIGEKPGSIDEVRGQYMGLLRFAPEGFARVQEVVAAAGDEGRRKLDMTTLLRRVLATGMPIAAVPVDGRWLEVDHAGELAAYEARLAQGEPWLHDWRW